MNLSRMIPYEQYHMREPVGASPLSELNTGSPSFVIKEYPNGDKEAVYNVNIIYLLDDLFTKGSFNTVSIEQERYLRRFFNEADKVMRKMDKNDECPFKDMSEIMQQLDNFLGSYMGVNNDRFIKEGQPALIFRERVHKGEQLYCCDKQACKRLSFPRSHR